MLVPFYLFCNHVKFMFLIKVHASYVIYLKGRAKSHALLTILFPLRKCFADFSLMKENLMKYFLNQRASRLVFCPPTISPVSHPPPTVQPCSLGRRTQGSGSHPTAGSLATAPFHGEHGVAAGPPPCHVLPTHAPRSSPAASSSLAPPRPHTHTPQACTC